MNSSNENNIRMLFLISDGICGFAAYWLSCSFWLSWFRKDTNIAQKPVLALLFALILMVLMNVSDSDRRHASEGLVPEKKWTVVVCIAAGFCMIIALFALHIQEFSRVVLFLTSCISFILILLKNCVLKALLNRWIEDLPRRRVLIAGTGEAALHFWEEISGDRNSGCEAAGFCGETADERFPLLGNFDRIEEIIIQEQIHDVVIDIQSEAGEKLRQIVADCMKNGVRVLFLPGNEMISAQPEVISFGGTKLLSLMANPQGNVMKAAVKRGFDLISSAAALLLLSPFMAVIALLIKLSSPGPVIFSQKRVGRDGRSFDMYKFRSMEVNEKETTGWSTNQDSRKTLIGALIRKLSIDELPQLWNVIKGDMSLVGPRPEVPFHVRRFRETIPSYMMRHQVLPGITGWAQVNGLRGDTSIEKRVEYDIWYIENWSLSLDTKILLKTVFGGMVNKEKIKTK